MGLPLDKLKSLIGQISFLSNNTVNSNNDNRQLNIHIHLPEGGATSPEEIEAATKAIQDVLQKESPNGFLISTPHSKETLKLIGGYSDKSRKNEIRKFVEKCIPLRDRSLWFSALVLRDEFSKGDTEIVNRLKMEMSRAAPGRGSNIANLCSTNYLESHIIPLYKYLVLENNDLPLFLEIYETIVTEFPFAVYVSQERSMAEIKKEIITKIEQVKKYGWNKVSVHGIGESNVTKIREVIPEVEEVCKEIENIDMSSYESRGKIITVNFNLKSEVKK